MEVVEFVWRWLVVLTRGEVSLQVGGGDFPFQRVFTRGNTRRLTDLKAKLVGVPPEVKDDTADRAEDQGHPHVHRG